MTDKRKDGSGKLLYCSFCGKSQHEVRKLIAGPSVYICDECVDSVSAGDQLCTIAQLQSYTKLTSCEILLCNSCL